MADRLKAQEQERRDVREFRRLADLARFYAATTDPVAENAPYFDPQQGEAKALAALALAAKWGPALAATPAAGRGCSAQTNRCTTAPPHGSRQEPANRRAGRGAGDARPARPRRRSWALRLRATSAFVPWPIGSPATIGRRPRSNSGPMIRGSSHPRSITSSLVRATGRRRPPGREKHRSGKTWQPDPDRMERAIDQYRQALRIDPEHYWSQFQLGRSYLSLSRFAEAVEALGACIALRPDAPWGYSVRGLALAQQKRYDEADLDLDRAIRLNPDFLPARLNRGVVYWRQGKLDLALADFEAVLGPPKEKRLIEAAFARGQLYLQRGDVQKALDDFNWVVAENPRVRSIFLYRAQIHISQGDNDRGLEDLDAYLDLGSEHDPRVWVIHGRRGHLLRDRYQQLPLDKRLQPSGVALLSLSVAELGKAVTLGGRAYDLFDDLGAMLEHADRVRPGHPRLLEGPGTRPQGCQAAAQTWLGARGAQPPRQGLGRFRRRGPRCSRECRSSHRAGLCPCRSKQPAEAQREAGMALLHGADNYLILHNVACIYAVLSQVSDGRRPAHEEAVIALLRARSRCGNSRKPTQNQAQASST